MVFIYRQYDNIDRSWPSDPDQIIGPPHRHERVVVPVPGLTRAVVQAVNFGRAITDDVQMIHVTDDVEERRTATRAHGAPAAGRARS